MIKTGKHTLVLIIICTTVFLSCKHEIPVIPPVIPPAPTVCFETDVLPLFQSNCAKSGCHDAATANGGYVLDNFTHIVSRGIIPGDSVNSQVYKALIGDGVERMPQAPNNALTAAQIHLVATWIQEGATNTGNCEGTCDTSMFTYSGQVRPILETNCLGCHSGMAFDGGMISLDTYDGVKIQVNGNFLLPAITHTGRVAMPQNGNKLSDCKIAIIQKWIAAGAPDN